MYRNGLEQCYRNLKQRRRKKPNGRKPRCIEEIARQAKEIKIRRVHATQKNGEVAKAIEEIK